MVTIAGRGGNVDGVDIVVKDQLIGVVVPFFHAMPIGKVLSRCAVATHYGDERTARCELESRAALQFGDGAATNDSPTNRFHSHVGPTSTRVASLIALARHAAGLSVADR